MDRAIEAATAAMRSAEAAMSKLLERDRSLHDVEEAGCVLQQLRIALASRCQTGRLKDARPSTPDPDDMSALCGGSRSLSFTSGPTLPRKSVSFPPRHEFGMS